MTKHDTPFFGIVPQWASARVKLDARPPDRVEALIKSLQESGDLSHPEWVDALRHVRRECFVPERAWVRRFGDGAGHAIDLNWDPDGWLAAVYSGDLIVTQIDDGDGDVTAGTGWRCTSSLSRLDSVIKHLQLLHPYDSDRVLEIGTGLGFTTGLLCHRLGPSSVVSIEIDKDLSERATVNLARFGYHPDLVVGDGTDGYADRAPYDRIHVTCGVTQIPYTWVEQSRPGGHIVLPWMPEWFGGHLVRLTVLPDGTAAGRIGDGTEYMMMRGQRSQAADLDHLVGDERTFEAAVDPRRIAWAGWGADVAIATLLPDVSGTYESLHNGETVRLVARTDDSELAVTYACDQRRPLVQQRGPRDLWAEVQEAYFAWVGLGQPARDRFGMTVTPDRGMRIWLDRPDRELTPLTSPDTQSFTAHEPAMTNRPNHLTAGALISPDGTGCK
jgi:protein-L-isoaspartate O-methyltransferase